MPAQLEDYLDVAREQQFDAVLTISNQLVTTPGEHPTPVDKKKTKKVSLVHLSWSQIHTEAVIERVNRSVADPDQAWILAELIRYLEHSRSGAVDFEDMGPSWVTVRNSVATRTLRSSDKTAAEVVGRYGQLVAFAGMRLSRDLGVDVRSVLSRAETRDVAARTQAGVSRLVDAGILHGALRVPNAAAPIDVTADLRVGSRHLFHHAGFAEPGAQCHASELADSAARQSARRHVDRSLGGVGAVAWARSPNHGRANGP